MTVRSSWLRLAALVGATAIWGWTFVVVKDAVSVYPVAGFLAYRFILATALTLPFLPRANWRSIGAGLPIGLVVGGAFLVQTAGLRITLASDTGLITGLSVVFVPLLEWLAFRRRIGRVTLLALLSAIAGLTLLVGGLPRQLALGDLLVGISAIGFAVQIILLSRRSPHHDTLSLTIGLMAGAALIFLIAALTPGAGGLAWPPAGVWPAILITAVLATVLGFSAQSWAQRELPATPAAIILLMEPAWAAFFGVILQGNPFPPARMIGAVLLVVTPVVLALAATGRARRILIKASSRERETAAV